MIKDDGTYICDVCNTIALRDQLFTAKVRTTHYNPSLSRCDSDVVRNYHICTKCYDDMYPRDPGIYIVMPAKGANK